MDESAVGEFHLDHRIQIWVLLPISIATALMSLLRRAITVIATEEPPTNLIKTRDSNTLARSANLRRSGGWISHEQFMVRKVYFVHPQTGVLTKPSKAKSAMSALMNPQHLANQVTALLSSLLPQMILGAWARYLFAGVAVCRLPFPLSQRFRGMLQSGMELAGQNVSVSYVSALSWYLLNLFGNAGFIRVITHGTDVTPPQQNLASQVAMNVGLEKVFETERSALQDVHYESLLDEAEQQLISG